MTTREKWSHSKLVKLGRCGEMFRRAYIENEWGPTSTSLVRGRVVHHIAQVGHERQLKARKAEPKKPRSLVLREALPSIEEVSDEAVTSFDAELRSNSIITVPEKDEDPKTSKAKIIERDRMAALHMSRFYIDRAAPFVDPIGVEKKLVIEPADSPIRVSGIIDLEAILPDGRRTIRDLKTTMRCPNDREADDSDQLSMYALLDYLSQPEGTRKLADVFALDHIVKDPRAFTAPYLVAQETTRKPNDLMVTLARLNNAIAAVKAGVFLANGPGNWWCSARFCTFYSDCRYVRGAA